MAGAMLLYFLQNVNPVALDPPFRLFKVSDDVRGVAVRGESFLVLPPLDENKATRLPRIAKHLVLEHSLFLAGGCKQTFKCFGQFFLTPGLCNGDRNCGYLRHAVLPSKEKETRGYTRAFDKERGLLSQPVSKKAAWRVKKVVREDRVLPVDEPFLNGPPNCGRPAERGAAA